MTKYELDKEYRRKQIRQTEVRTMANEMDLARIRGDLLERKLVEKQLAFFLVAIRQKLLIFPTTLASKLLHKEDKKEVHAILQQAIFVLLTELKDLPNKVIDPNWLQNLEDE
jgi:hypothetical protein